jgi:hypothetical protein
VQLGLTATPKRTLNADTYAYFGEPVFVYSLKEGINDGFLTPFKVRQIATTLDDYVYTPDDLVVQGDIKAGKRYEEKDFNRIIEIKEREAYRVMLVMGMIDPREKTLVVPPWLSSRLSLSYSELVRTRLPPLSSSSCRVRPAASRVRISTLAPSRRTSSTWPRLSLV